MKGLVAASLLAVLLLAPAPRAPAAGPAAPAPSPAPWFTNVTKTVGLAGVPAKDGILVDLDGDGYLDLCLDRHRFFLSKDEGKKFVPLEDSGIEFPVVKVVPLGGGGKPDLAHAKTEPYVPEYLYFADIDNDGDQDAIYGVHTACDTFVEKPSPHWVRVPECDPGVRSSIWLNDGTGKFVRGPKSEFTSDAEAGPAMALAVTDYDLDGKLDLYEGREYRRYGYLWGCGVDRLFKGDGKGGFTDVTKKAGMWTVAEPGGPRSSRPSYGVTVADWNNDGYPDLLELSYGRQWNRLWRNNGDGTFTDVGMKTGFAGDDITDGRYPPIVHRPAEQPFRSNGNTFDCAVGDINGDGNLDFLLGEIKHWWAGPSSDPPSILINEGKAKGWKLDRHPVSKFLPPRHFRNPARYNYGDLHVSFADFDNDGRLDVLIGSGDYPDGQFLRLYHQEKDGSFTDVTKVAGFHWEGCGDLSIGDYDRDGDVDILAGRSFVRLSQKYRDKYMGGIKVNEVGLFRNDYANRTGNHWIELDLVGKSANRSGIGARVDLTAGGHTQIREVRCGSGLSNHEDPPQVHFGIGKATKIDRIVVHWPDAKHSTTVLTNVKPDRYLTVRQ